MKAKKINTKFLIIILVFSLIFSGNSLIFFSTDACISFDNNSSRAVVGPTEMLKNNEITVAESAFMDGRELALKKRYIDFWVEKITCH